MEKNMTKGYELNLDFGGDMEFFSFGDMCMKYEFEVSYFNPVGPGGGNPNITLVARSKEVFEKFMVEEYCKGMESEIEFYMSGIKEIDYDFAPTYKERFNLE